MIKRTFLILFAILICIHDVNSQCTLSTDGNSVDKKACQDRKIGTEEDYELSLFSKPVTDCCYVEYSYQDSSKTAKTQKYCGAFNKGKLIDDLDKVKKWQDELKKLYPDETEDLGEYSIDCFSSYIKFGIMSLLTFLF